MRDIYILKVTLRGSRPAIWRRLEVPADLTLIDFHGVLQAAMGWTNSHMHQFIHAGVDYGVPDREFGAPMASERRTRLHDLVERPKDRLTYEYDFGDSWNHEIVLEAIEDSRPGVKYPRVIDGKRACPPEDVGGLPGYEEFVAALRDPGHEEHENMRAWAGGDFDSERFDLIAANDAIPKRRASRRRDA